MKYVLAKAIARIAPPPSLKTAQSNPFWYQIEYKVPGNPLWNAKRTIFTISLGKKTFQG